MRLQRESANFGAARTNATCTMAISRLDFDYDYDFLLFGIRSHMKDYRLCWSLNRQLEIDLAREEDIQLDDKSEPRLFSFYTFDNEEQRLRYILVANRGEVGYLVNEQKQADYFLVIEGFYDQLNRPEVLDKVRKSPFVLTAFELDPNELKSRQNLLFD